MLEVESERTEERKSDNHVISSTVLAKRIIFTSSPSTQVQT